MPTTRIVAPEATSIVSPSTTRVTSYSRTRGLAAGLGFDGAVVAGGGADVSGAVLVGSADSLGWADSDEDFAVVTALSPEVSSPPKIAPRTTVRMSSPKRPPMMLIVILNQRGRGGRAPGWSGLIAVLMSSLWLVVGDAGQEVGLPKVSTMLAVTLQSSPSSAWIRSISSWPTNLVMPTRLCWPGRIRTVLVSVTLPPPAWNQTALTLVTVPTLPVLCSVASATNRKPFGV